MMKTLIASCLAALFVSVLADAQKTIVTLTESEYREVIDDVLSCPGSVVADDATQLCLRIIPPGHRRDERELLVILRSKGKNMDLELRQPEESIARIATRVKTALPAQWRTAMNIAVRSKCTSEPRVIESIVGPSWREITSPVVPSDEWFIDATMYQVRAQSVAGTVVIEVDGPGRKGRQPTSLLMWAEAVRSKAEAILHDTTRTGSDSLSLCSAKTLDGREEK